MKYQVLDNGKPADCFHHNVRSCWNISAYDTFDTAYLYANDWLGDPHCFVLYDSKGERTLKLNIPLNYSGYGDTIEIREVE